MKYSTLFQDIWAFPGHSPLCGVEIIYTMFEAGRLRCLFQARFLALQDDRDMKLALSFTDTCTISLGTKMPSYASVLFLLYPEKPTTGTYTEIDIRRSHLNTLILQQIHLNIYLPSYATARDSKVASFLQFSPATISCLFVTSSMRADVPFSYFSSILSR